MAANSPKTSKRYPTDNVNFMDMMATFSDNEAARAYLEAIRWPHGVICPHCGVSREATRLQGKAHRRGVWKCNACKRQFTVTVGTIFEDSHIPLGKWIVAFYLMVSSKKGMSAHQLHRMLGITYKCAWHMAHRIRFAFKDVVDGKLTGTVEADETYVGGKARNAHRNKPVPVKTAVVALVERNGRVKARAVPNVDGENIGKMLKEHVRKSATLMTDGAPVYDAPGSDFKEHHAVNHEARLYVKGGGHIHTQTVESFNSMVKRGIIGAYHHISVEHLPRYLDEFAFRWDHRFVSDGTRMEAALGQTEGKRLTLMASKAEKSAE